MAGDARLAAIDRVLAEAVRAHETARQRDLAPVLAAADAMASAFARGGKVLVFGNGGSAAEAQHFATELVGRFERERRAVAVVALTTDTSVLTAVANDYAFDRVFARQIEALGAVGDVAVGLTTSGESANVLAALEAAKARGLTTVALTGRDGGAAGRAADIHLHVAEASTARVQEVHLTLLHAICGIIEAGL